MARAYIGLGSNLGDRAANIEAAVAMLRATKGVEVVRRSSVRETAPLDAPPPCFLNTAVAVDTDLPPRELLARCHEIEAVLGRERPYRNAPRTIDLDLLLYDDLVIDLPDLTVPHPGIRRPFVTESLAEIAPTLRHPTDGSLLHHVASSPRSEVLGQSGSVARKVRP